MAGNLAERFKGNDKRDIGGVDDSSIKNLQIRECIIVGGTANEDGDYERLRRRFEELKGRLCLDESYHYLIISGKNKQFAELVIYRREKNENI